MKPVLKFNAGTREINPTVTPTTRKPLIRWDSPATTVWILLTTKKVYLYRLWTTFRNNTNRNHIRLEIVMDAFKLKTLLRPCVHQSVFPAAGVFFQLFSMGARWYSLSSFFARPKSHEPTLTERRVRLFFLVRGSTTLHPKQGPEQVLYIVSTF